MLINKNYTMGTKFNVGDLVRYISRPGAEIEYGYVKHVRIEKDILKVWVVYFRKGDINTNWTAQLTPADKLEKVN